MKLNHIIFLILSLIVITIPRFNWGEAGPLKSFVGSKPFDVEQYISYTKYFRGDSEIASELEGPFAYRPLVPFLASLLPFKAFTSINIVCLIFLILALFPLIGLLKIFNLNGNYLFLGGLLFVFSFPAFYYGTSGYIDSVLIAFLMVGTYLIFSKNIFLFFLTFTCGMCVKETIIILIPVFAIYIFFLTKFSSKKKFILILSTAIIYGVGMILLRKLTPGSESYLWYPSFNVLLDNLVRVKTYLSILLTFGLPGIGAMFYIYIIFSGKIKLTREAPLITGMLISILISLFSLLAAYADGRHIWTSYPFTIPLTLIYLKSLRQSNFSFLKHKILK